METRSEANPLGEIDRLHAAIVADTAAGTPAAETVAGGDLAPDGTASGETLDAGFCEEILAEALEGFAQETYDDFYESLKPLIGHEKADRIAKRAAISEGKQRMIVSNGTRVAKKHGADKFISPELALLGAAGMCALSYFSARRDRDKILAAAQPKQPQALTP